MHCVQGTLDRRELLVLGLSTHYPSSESWERDGSSTRGRDWFVATCSIPDPYYTTETASRYIGLGATPDELRISLQRERQAGDAGRLQHAERQPEVVHRRARGRGDAEKIVDHDIIPCEFIAIRTQP